MMSIQTQTAAPSISFEEQCEKFEILLRDVRIEIERTLKVVKQTNTPVSYQKGPVITAYRRDLFTFNTPSRYALVPEFSSDVRQWHIPGMGLRLTDLGGALVAVKDGEEFPSIIELDEFTVASIDELKQLYDSLQTLRAYCA
jgi:hypothetical protein